jgi:hypothetical protein
VLGDLKTYWRFSLGLPAFLRHRTTPAEAHAVVQRRMAEREDNFLRLVERGVFGYPRSPYRALLAHAGCTFGDLRDMVRARGLEATLHALYEAGVYVTFEELKGRAPIVRNGHVIPVKASDFDNPFLKHYYEGASGGTTGPGTRISLELDQLAASAVPLHTVTQEAHGLLGAPTALWRGILPDVTGVSNILQGARMGNVPQRWFTPVTRQDAPQPLRYHLATQHILLLSRLLGVRAPRPEPLPLDRAAVIARWAIETVARHGRALLRCHASMGLRIALAARDEGLDLAGTAILGGGEPPTPAKVREITRSGARWIPTYASGEATQIGMGCANPADGNDVHFFKDCLALIQRPQPVPGTQLAVDAFHFTSLLPTAPKLLLNAANDDYGVVERRSCGCLLEVCGYTEHLRHTRSFRKLTGEGITLVGSDLLRILDEVLPARFGGSPLDYQLAEVEDDRGFTRLDLVVSPRVQIADESAVIEVVLQSIDNTYGARAVWRQARTLRIRREEPIWTDRGKLMPLHLTRRRATDG